MFKLSGQNCFKEYFFGYINTNIEKCIENGSQPKNFASFLSDAIVCAYERWLEDKDKDMPEVFFNELKECLKQIK